MIQSVGAQRADNGIQHGKGIFVKMIGIGHRDQLGDHKDIALMIKAHIAARLAVQKGVERLNIIVFIFRIGFDYQHKITLSKAENPPLYQIYEILVRIGVGVELAYLDIRKIDKRQMKLQCQETDMVQYVGNVLKSYDYTAKERNIDFSYKPAIDKLNVWLDRSALDKVVDNLLSNAFKYTYDGGSIEVRVAEGDHNTAVLQVVDTGMGIKGDTSRLFDRFYSNSHSLHIEGTGIGLNLCKMMVEMHHGTIEAANRDDVQGSVFTVHLPLGKAHLSAEDILIPEEKDQVQRQKAQTSYKVLVVDDDEEIGNYIAQELGGYYHITAVTNGREALRLLLSTDTDRQYDLVVSDVMMPEMDGFTMLRMIKKNMNLSHIPVVMLTSKSDVANRLEGLERGADAFLAKPFDMEELHVVINNLISKNLLLKGKFSGIQQQKDKVVETNVRGNDEILMERVMKVINEHLSDSDFGVDMLTKEVGISRAQLHRKMKEITGLPISEFIRNIRLEQAVRLLKEQKVNVTQVAYSVGFSSLPHFSTVFSLVLKFILTLRQNFL